MSWKTIVIIGTALILWLLLVIFIKTNKLDTHEVEMTTTESDKQLKSLAEIKEEIQFIVQDSIEEEIQKEVQKAFEQSENTNGSSGKDNE